MELHAKHLRNSKIKKRLVDFRKESLLNRTQGELWAEREILKIARRDDFQVEYIYDLRRFDFYFPFLKLAIEIDGGYHNSESQKLKDVESDIEMKKKGITVLRCSNFDNVRLKEILDGLSEALKKKHEKSDARAKKREEKKNRKKFALISNVSKKKKNKIKKEILKSLGPKDHYQSRLKASVNIHASLRFKSKADINEFIKKQKERLEGVSFKQEQHLTNDE